MSTKETWYIAGPMTGIPQFNFPAFLDAASRLRGMGYNVISPAEIDRDETRLAALNSKDGAEGSGSPNGETWGDFLARDVKLVADEVHGVVFLPDWHKSRGAVLEAVVALLTKKKFGVFDYEHGILPISYDHVKQRAYGRL